MEFWVVLFLFLLMGFVTAKLAEERGRNPFLWFMIGSFFGFLGLAALFLLDFLQPVPPIKDGEKEEGYPETPTKTVSIYEAAEKADPLELGVWYYANGASSQGPLDFMDLYTAWEEGRLTGNSLIWHESFPEWKRLDHSQKVLELFEEIRHRDFSNEEEEEKP